MSTTTAAPEKDPLVEDIMARLGLDAEEIKALPDEELKQEAAETTEQQPEGEAAFAPPSYETAGQRAVRMAKETKPAEEPAPEDKAKEAPTEKPVEQQPKTAVTKKVAPKPQPPAPAPSPAQQVQPPAPAPQPPKPVVEEESFTEEQRDILAAAEWGEKNMPEDFKGKTSELKSYFKKLAAFVAENPDVTEDSEEFEKFTAKNKPKISQRLIEKATRGQLKEEAAREAEERLRPQFEQVREQLRRQEAVPQAKKEIERFQEELSKAQIEEGETFSDVIKQVKEDPEKAETEYPLEAPIVKRTVQLAETYVQINRNLVPFNQGDQDHAALSRFVFTQADKLKALPVEKQARNGKLFKDPQELAALYQQNPQEAVKYWTFTESDVLRMLQAKAAKDIKTERARALAAAEKLTSRKKSTTAPTPDTATQSPPKAPAVIAKPAVGKGSLTVGDQFIRDLIPGISAA